MKLYLAGPMTGKPYYNFPAFDEAAGVLRALGHTVVSPADMDRAHGYDALQGGEPPFTLRECLGWDLPELLTCDAVVVLPEWEQSRGAKMEVTLARTVGLSILQAVTLDPIEEPRQTMPTDSAGRKGVPLVTGVLDYFPAALAAVARLSKYGNEKHNPGEPLHWARGKSADHADCVGRHLVDRGLIDPETGMSHTVEVAWRALALLQEELEAAGAPKARGAY